MTSKQNNKSNQYLLNLFGIKTKIVKPNINERFPKGFPYEDDVTIAFSKLVNLSYDEIFESQIRYMRMYYLQLSYYGLIVYNLAMEFHLRVIMQNSNSKITVCEFMMQHQNGEFLILASNTNAICYKNGIWYSRMKNIKNADEILTKEVVCVFERGDTCESIKPNRKMDFVLQELGIEYKVRTFKMNEIARQNELDDNNCTTFALSKIGNIPYYKIRNEQLEVARQSGSININTIFITQMIAEQFLGLTKLPDEEVYGISLAKFLYENKKGKYLITTNDHAICYIDGVWIIQKNETSYLDTFLSEKIIYVWKEED